MAEVGQIVPMRWQSGRTGRRRRHDPLRYHLPVTTLSPARSSGERSRGHLAGVVAAAALVALVAVVWHPVLGADFIVLDDPSYVTENPRVREGITPDGILWALSGRDADGAYWQPLTWLSHMLDVELFGLDPTWHHLGNLVLHTVNVLLVFAGLRWASGRFWASLVVAALFAVHPLNVESVAWVSERKNLLSTLFLLLCAGCYLWYATRPGVLRYGAVLATLALGLATKPMLVTVPILLLLLDVWPLVRLTPEQLTSRSARGLRSAAWLVLEKAPLAVMTAACSAVVVLSLRPVSNVSVTAVVPFGLRVANALWSIPAYLGKILAPRDLSVFYPYPKELPWWQPAIGATVLALIVIAGLAAIRTRPWFTAGAWWFVVSLIPVLGLVQSGEWPAIADRWAYVPMLGVLVVVVWGTSELAGAIPPGRRGLICGGAAVAAVASLAMVTTVHARLWQSSPPLFEHALALEPDNHLALMSLGNHAAVVGDHERAIAYFERTLRASPHEPEVLTDLALLLSERGAQPRAAELLRHSLELAPEKVRTYNALGVVLARSGRPDDARSAFLAALEIDPDHADARRNLNRLETLRSPPAGGAVDPSNPHPRQDSR